MLRFDYAPLNHFSLAVSSFLRWLKKCRSFLGYKALARTVFTFSFLVWYIIGTIIQQFVRSLLVMKRFSGTQLEFCFSYIIRPVGWDVEYVVIHVLADGANTTCFALRHFPSATCEHVASGHFNEGSAAEEKQFWPRSWDQEAVANMSKRLS